MCVLCVHARMCTSVCTAESCPVCMYQTNYHISGIFDGDFNLAV